MRLIGSLTTQDQAKAFQKYCKNHKIDLVLDKAGTDIQLWAINEDETPEAQKLLAKFLKDPAAPEFFVLQDSLSDNNDDYAPKAAVVQKNPRLPVLTWIWILISVICFLIQMGQTVSLIKTRGGLGPEVTLTQIEQDLFFDVPQGFEELNKFIMDHGIKLESDLNNLSPEDLQAWIHLKQTAYFHGFLDMVEDSSYRSSYQDTSMPLFQKLKQGELYRLITPVFLHGSIIHILFNMIWLFVLMKQIEMKLGVIKTICLAFSFALVSNITQYLVSGPFFVGASGVIVGMAAFIWMRQKKAPWEGYILSRSLLLFLMIYVLSLVVLSIGVFVFNLASHKNLAFGIANSAHVAGGLTGLFLGARLLFRRP